MPAKIELVPLVPTDPRIEPAINDQIKLHYTSIQTGEQQIPQYETVFAGDKEETRDAQLATAQKILHEKEAIDRLRKAYGVPPYFSEIEEVKK